MKIINILNNFTRLQSHSFDLFMKSPFFHIEKEFQQLYKLIAPFLKKGTLSAIPSGSLYKQYHSRYEALTPAQFNKLTFRFRSVIEQFLAHDHFAKNKAQKRTAVVNSYAQMSDTKFYRKAIDQELLLLEKSTKKDRLYYFQLFQSQSELYFHPITVKRETSSGFLLHNAQRNLDRFYISSKLQIAIELLYRNKIMAEKHHIELFDQLITLAEAEPSPLFDLYRALTTLLREEHTEENFLRAKEAFETQLPFLDKKDKSGILTILLNEANAQYRKGQLAYLTHLIEIYELGLKNKLLLDNTGQLSEVLFTNITILYCLRKDFDAAYFHIQANKKYLAPITRKNAIKFSWAYIHFHSGNFEDAWSLLRHVTFTVTEYKIQHRSLLLRCFYESLPSDVLLREKILTELKNFRRFIYRLNTNFNLLKTPYYNQISVIRALTEFNPHVDNKKRFQKKWRKFIAENPPMTKKWLKEKIDELGA